MPDPTASPQQPAVKTEARTTHAQLDKVKESPPAESDAQLREIREREAKATAGPWEYEKEKQAAGRALVMLFETVKADGVRLLRFSHENGEPDAKFIAHARADVPYLLARVDSLKQSEARMRGALPQTVDGVSIVPGMLVYWRSASPSTIEGVKVLSVGDGDAEFSDGREVLGIPLEWAFSTRESALAASALSATEAVEKA